MKEIELTQGQVAIVDNEDYEYLNQFKWYAHWSPRLNGYYAVRHQHLGYSNGERKQKMIIMHRIIVNAPNGKVVDHKNHNALDNRKSNLRIVSQRQNNQNKKSKGTSKYPGVHWEMKRNKWRANIQLEGKSKHLGYFDDEREAAKAYENACREIIGEELVCKM